MVLKIIYYYRLINYLYIIYFLDWGHITEGAKNFIRKMLDVDVKKRYSIQQCLNDKWLKENCKSDSYVPTNALNKIGSFSTKNKLKQAVFTFIVTQIMNAQEKEEIEKAFKSLDTNNDGMLTKEELVEGNLYFTVYIIYFYY